jgi:hypothetical protein
LEAVLVWLEGAALGQLVRASGVWAYAVLNLVHILGVATLFGSILVLDLRLLGCWRQVPLAALERPTVPLAVLGFTMAAASGVAMLSANASEYAGNPFLPLKFGAIVLGGANLAVLQTFSAWQARAAPEQSAVARRQLAVAGGVSLLCWLTAVASGRMLGYW